MLFLAALPVVSFFFPGFAIAVISAPDCRSTWEWSFNSLGQSACMVAAFMMSTCNAGSFTVDPLPQGHSYPGPGGTDDSNLCKCSTVGYSLLSACAGCQGEHWISWSEYVTNCTTTLPPSFPNPIPSGTLVPRASGLSSTSQKRTFGTPTNRLSSVIPSSETQFKPGGHHRRRHRWCSSNLHPCCRVVLLSATATFGVVPRVRWRHCI
ncbi:hypothetical protein V8E52_004740 [Russula decolorans]